MGPLHAVAGPVAPAAAGEQVDVLRADVALALELAPAPGAGAVNAVASVHTLAPGLWDSLAQLAATPEWLGVLVLDGFLGRESRGGGSSLLELAGPGELVRPWEDGPLPLAQATVAWHALEPARLALLDAAFAEQIASRPDLTLALMARAERRAQRLAEQLALAQLARLSDRILHALAGLARRWGRPGADGLLLELRLSDEQLAAIVGARPPAVTIALGELRACGLLLRQAEGSWLVSAPPGTAGGWWRH